MDIELIKQLHSSIGWGELVKEIDKRVDMEIVKLKIATSETVIRIQERIRALEELKSLPEQIIEREG